VPGISSVPIQVQNIQFGGSGIESSPARERLPGFIIHVVPRQTGLHRQFCGQEAAGRSGGGEAFEGTVIAHALTVLLAVNEFAQGEPIGTS